MGTKIISFKAGSKIPRFEEKDFEWQPDFIKSFRFVCLEPEEGKDFVHIEAARKRTRKSKKDKGEKQ